MNWRAASAWRGKNCPSRGTRSRSKSLRPDRPSVYVNLGPHPPRLWPEDLDRAHDIWLGLQENFGSRLHHRDVVGVALRRLQKDLESERKEEALGDLGNELRKT